MSEESKPKAIWRRFAGQKREMWSHSLPED